MSAVHSPTILGAWWRSATAATGIRYCGCHQVFSCWHGEWFGWIEASTIEGHGQCADGIAAWSTSSNTFGRFYPSLSAALFVVSSPRWPAVRSVIESLCVLLRGSSLLMWSKDRAEAAAHALQRVIYKCYDKVHDLFQGSTILTWEAAEGKERR